MKIGVSKLSNLLSPPGNRYRAKNEYESSVFILDDNDIVSNPKNDTKFGFSRLKSNASKSVILLFIVSVLASLLIMMPSKTTPAQACGVTDPLSCVTEATENLTQKVVESFRGIFCTAGDPTVYTYPESAWAGTGAMMFPSGIGAIQGIARLAKGAALDTSKPYTAYEKYGTSGTNFTFYRDEIKDVQAYSCVPFSKLLGNTAANSIFSLTETISAFAGWVYSFAVGTDAFSGMIDSLDKILGGENSGIIGKLYINYMAPMIMLGALYALWFGIVKRAFSVAGSSIVWMLLSIVCGLAIMYNSSGFVNFTNGLVQGMVSQTTGVIGGISANSGEKIEGQNNLPDLCSLPGDDKIDSAKVQRIVDCRIWQAFVYYPWATGQFGIPPNQGNIKAGNVTTDIKFGPGNTKKLDFRAAQLDAQSLDYSNPMVGPQTSTALKNKVKQYTAIANAMAKEESLRPYANSWAGNDIQNRLNIAVFSVIAALGGTLIIISISLSMIIYQVGTIFLILVSPLFLLIGIHPGFGKGIALKWLELLVETVLKRIVLGIFISVIVSVFMFLTVSSASVGYMETLLLLIVLSIAGLMYKNKFLDLVSALNFGGTQTGLEGWKDKTKGFSKSALLAGAGAGIGMAKAVPGLGKVANAASKVKLSQGATAQAATKFGKSQASKAFLKAGFDGAKGSIANKNRYTSPTLRSIKGAANAVDSNKPSKWEQEVEAMDKEQAEARDKAEKQAKQDAKEADKKLKAQQKAEKEAIAAQQRTRKEAVEAERRAMEDQREQERQAAYQAERKAREQREERMAGSMENILATLRGQNSRGQGQSRDVLIPQKPSQAPTAGNLPPKPEHKPTAGEGGITPKKPEQFPRTNQTKLPPKPENPPKPNQGNLPPKPEHKPTAGKEDKAGQLPPPNSSQSKIPPKPKNPPKPSQAPTAGQEKKNNNNNSLKNFQQGRTQKSGGENNTPKPTKNVTQPSPKPRNSPPPPPSK